MITRSDPRDFTFSDPLPWPVSWRAGQPTPTIAA
jgi:hypothetical protein